MDEFYGPHDHRFCSSRSSWHRIQGDGEPTDFSDGASTAGDWKGPEPEPIPRPFRAARQPAARGPRVATTRPRLALQPQRHPPIAPVTGFRAWLATALRAFDQEEPDR